MRGMWSEEHAGNVVIVVDTDTGLDTERLAPSKVDLVLAFTGSLIPISWNDLI